LVAGYNESMQKRKIIIIAGFIILLVAIVFAWVIFFPKKSINITNNKQETINNEQQIADNTQNTEEIDNKQSGLDNNPSPADGDQSPTVNAQENKKSATDPSVTDNETKSSAGKIVDKFISWGFQKSDGRKIDTIIIHSSYDALGDDPYSISGIIAEYKQYGVSAHYLIARDGTIYHLVADKNIAYHAGVSETPDGRTNVNNFSIGVEMVNTLDGKFTSDQYAALNRLIASLKKQYSIKYILGHDDIAPGRKTDPWNIEWNKVDK